MFKKQQRPGVLVCDDAADETCPCRRGHPITSHWGVEDAARATGTEHHKRDVFHRVCHRLRAQLAIFVSLPLHMLEKHAIHEEVAVIGRSERAVPAEGAAP